ncbi:MAG: hypothetical protein ABIC04_00805 [Nanoarchaeota archaeon]
MVKKGVFFSIDAFIAVILILSVVAVGSVFFIVKESSTQPVYYSSDIVQILSTLKIGEIKEASVKNFLNNTNITDYNVTILEQVLRFQVEGEFDKANELLNLTISDLVPDRYGIGVWVEGYDYPLFNSTPNNAKQLISSKQLVSGLEKDRVVEGLSSRAILSNIDERTSSSYAYFGGYEGDGNITKILELPNSFLSIQSAYMELSAGSEFDLYINGNLSGNYSPSLGVDVKTWEIPGQYHANFQPGINSLLLSFKGDDKYIGGGYIKVTYSTSELVGYDDSFTQTYDFPGIEGIINLYSSFYVPGIINSMKIYLHYKSDYEMFLKVGGRTVFDYPQTGEKKVNISNDELVLNLNYSEISDKTIPLRLGLRNVSYETLTNFADVYSVTDLSGSMSWGTPPKVGQAIESNRILVNAILNVTKNRVGLVGYDDTARSEWFHELSDDAESLNNKLDDYSTGGGTCICCGINRAIAAFRQSDSSATGGSSGGTAQSRIATDNDDAEERLSDGRMSLTSSDLELVEDSGGQKIGLRFQNMDIPVGATITGAYIEFETDETGSGATTLSFFAQAADDASTFTSSYGDISDRVKTNSTVTWVNVPVWDTVSEKHQTPDLSPIIQEVIDRAGWWMSNSIAIIVNGTGKRTAESYNGESANAPLLVVTYSSGPMTLLSSRVAQSTDDSEELLSNGDISLSSSDLELIYDGGNQEVGMRFMDIYVPKRATIQGAYIEFETDETSSGATTLTFSAQATDDASTFSGSDGDISSREKTNATVNWANVPAWGTVSQKHKTPDLSSIIQEVIDRPGWVNGNSIAIIVDGTGKRTAESYDGESSNGPLLVITYLSGPLTCGDAIVDEGEECDDGNSNNSDNCINACLNATCMDGFVWSAGGEECDNGGICTGDDSTACTADADCETVGGVCTPRNDDGCADDCTFEDRIKVMIVMTDGQANVECSEQGTGNADNDAIQAACDAYNNYGISVHSVGFGTDVDEGVLQDIADCGNGDYYYSDVGELGDLYSIIASDIIQAQYSAQTIDIKGNISTNLYPDSYISFNYTPLINSYEYGRLPLTIESPRLDNNISEGMFYVPDSVVLYDAKITSYSGDKWTDRASINYNDNWISIFNLSSYGWDYHMLGDPYIVHIPGYLVKEGENDIRISTGVNPLNSTGGSLYDRIIYTVGIDIDVNYTGVFEKADGCTWTIKFEDDTNATITIPSKYIGPKKCDFTEEVICNIDYADDAIDNSVCRLFEQLDIDSDGKLFVKFGPEDLQVDTYSIGKIPYMWGPTVFEIRVWQ